MKKAIGILIGICVLSASAAKGMDPQLVNPDEKVFGKTLSDYSSEWWRWAMSAPSGHRAYDDENGESCARGQNGSVWFLAGTNGSSTVSRKCTVAQGQYLFFPVINMIHYAARGSHPTCKEVKAGAAANNDFLQYAIVKIDGHPVPDVKRYRAASKECFDAFARADYMSDAHAFFPAASDGYWLLVRPLAIGTHHISVRANYANPAAGADPFGKMIQYFDYTIQIVRPDL